MAMTIVEVDRAIVGGVDTHLDNHVAAALDPLGALLGTESFATTPAGYKLLLSWLGQFGTVTKVGVEGTGAYGAGLARFLRKEGIDVVEVDRPNRMARRLHGKSDPLDAVEAARAALSGRAGGQAKTPDGAEQELWSLLCAYHAIRELICAAAELTDQDPLRLSFIAALDAVRGPVGDPAAFPP